MPFMFTLTALGRLQHGVSARKVLIGTSFQSCSAYYMSKLPGLELLCIVATSYSEMGRPDRWGIWYTVDDMYISTFIVL